MADLLSCPDARLLQELALGRLTDAEAESLERHVEHCPRCGQTLLSLGEDDDLLHDLRRPAGTGEVVKSGALEDLIERMKRLRQEPQFDETGAEATREWGVEAGNDAVEILAPPQAADELGRLGRYRVLKVLGQGGMGIVFQAEDPLLARRVALKVIRPGLAASSSARERFLREARAAAAIEDDHIVAVYEAAIEGGLPFLAMPLLKGETLETRLQREGKLLPAEAVRIVREVAEGLAALHEQGLIHRDIKPSNVWLEGERRRVKILDFGLAQVAGAEARLTSPGSIAGTPHYMAPEQARGDEASPRSDLFSLGCILYLATTGKLPFDGSSTLQVLRALELVDPQPPCTLEPGLPPALADLTMRLLARDPAARPASARTLIAALDALKIVPSAPAGAGVDTKDTLIIQPRRRRRWLRWRLLVPALVLLPLLGLGGALLLPRLAPHPQPNPEPSAPVDSTKPKEPPPTPKHARLLRVLKDKANAAIGPVAISADGRHALSGCWDNTMRLWDLESGQRLHAFGGHGGWVWCVAFAPDGRRALCGGTVGRTVYLWDLESGKKVDRIEGLPGSPLAVGFTSSGPRIVTDGGINTSELHLWDVKDDRELRTFTGHTDRVWRVVLAADGKRLVSASRDRTVRLWDADTGKELRRFEGHAAAVRAVDLSADGERVLSGDEDGIVCVWDARSGKKLLRLQGHQGPVESVAFSPDGRRALSGGHDNTARLWDVATGKELDRLEGHEGLVAGVAFTPDGRRALTGSADGTLRLWQLPK